jgi:hypothetical protein
LPSTVTGRGGTTGRIDDLAVTERSAETDGERCRRIDFDKRAVARRQT